MQRLQAAHMCVGGVYDMYCTSSLHWSLCVCVEGGVGRRVGWHRGPTA